MKPEKPKKLGFKKIYLNLDKILFLFLFVNIKHVFVALCKAMVESFTVI